MVSSNRQFGFKKGVGCRDAIFTVKSIINHYTSNNSTINLCALDITKAFDRVNHDILFKNLMERKIPVYFLSMLRNWYAKIFISVRWGDSLSSWVKLISGVRQGGILSPFLFAVLVDPVLDKLACSKLGCRIKDFCLNSIMYADDLMLLSISLNHLHFCVNEFEHLGLQINVLKSACMRIGAKNKNIDNSILIKNVFLAWKQEIKYLRIRILAGNKFSYNLQIARQKFFRAVNGLFGKIDVKSLPTVACSLIKLFCLPILLYYLEVIDLFFFFLTDKQFIQ